MILAGGLLAVGLLAPYVLRRLSQQMSPRLVIAANLAGLMLAWLGIIDVISVWVMPEHGLLGLCRTAFFTPHELDDVHGGWVLLSVAVALGGRALWSMWRTWQGMSLARRHMGSDLQASGGLLFAKLGTVACTVGYLRPRIVVDEALISVLNPRQQRAVIAHERSHARGWHALIDLGARALAAGLAPWPGARIAHKEIRRHLEAAADDWAAGRTSRRDVATAIVEAAMPSPPAAVLGAAGWALWRVDRLLSPRPRRLWHAIAAIALVGLTFAVVVQLSTHAAAGIHLLPPDLPCCRA